MPTKAQLLTSISTDLPDNTSKLITPAILRSTLDDIVNYADVYGGAGGALAGYLPVKAVAIANINIASAPTTIDGVTIVANDRVLLTAQTTGSQNGIYIWHSAAAAMTRATDLDASNKIIYGGTIAVNKGTANAGTIWVLSGTSPLVLGTDTLNFIDASGGPAGVTEIGDIYNKSSWVNMSDFTESAGSATIVGGKIRMPGGPYLIRFPLFSPTMLAEFKLEISMIVNTVATANNFAILFTSTNTAPQDVSFQAGFNSAGATFFLQTGPTVGAVNSGNTIAAPQIGDVINITVSRTYASIYVALRNLTQQTISIISSPVLSATTVAVNNTATIGLLVNVSGGEYDITNIRYSGQDEQAPERLLLCDSIGWGAGALQTLRYADLAALSVNGGPGDVAHSVLDRMNEILTFVKPKKVFIHIGRNDSTAAMAGDYAAIVTALNNAGITDIVHCTPLPQTGFNLTTFKNFVAAYPNVIDLWTPMLGTGTDMNAHYDTGDGVHPNILGHKVIADTILASPYY